MKGIIIFDLDGTLAIINKRKQLAMQSGKMNWKTFFAPENIALDEPNLPVILTLIALRKMGHRIFIFSGRDNISEKETREWLAKHNITFDLLMMRAHDDYTPDNVLKKSWLDELGELKNQIICVFDDRDKVVKMWREEGLTCFQVAEGDF